MPAAKTFDTDVCTGSQNFPAVRSAWVRLFQFDDISQKEFHGHEDTPQLKLMEIISNSWRPEQ